MDVITQLGELALASRLKRLSDRLLKDVSQVYGELNVDFQARWFPVLHALGRKSPLAITELAQALGLSHPAVNQITGPMIRRGLLQQGKDRGDERRRLLRLTAKGRAVIDRLEPVWGEIRAANRDLLDEVGIDLLGHLERIESALDDQSMEERVRKRLGLENKPPIVIVDYRPAYKKHFRALNEQWLETHFRVEPADRRLLDDPNRTILKRGGSILFALQGGEVVGTCALLRHAQPRKRAARRAGGLPGARLLELSKMAVAEAARRQGIGTMLTREVIDRAVAAGAGHLYLQTSPDLKIAGRLYRKLGFRRVRHHPLSDDKYHRHTITMRLDLARYRASATAKETS